MTYSLEKSWRFVYLVDKLDLNCARDRVLKFGSYIVRGNIYLVDKLDLNCARDRVLKFGSYIVRGNMLY